MVAEDDDPWSAKRSGFQRSRSLDVTMMDTLSKYGGGSQSGYVHTEGPRLTRILGLGKNRVT